MSDIPSGTPPWTTPAAGPQRPHGLSPTVTTVTRIVLWLVAGVALLAAGTIGWLARTYHRWRAEGAPSTRPSPTSMTEAPVLDLDRLDPLDRAQIIAFLAICLVCLSAVVVMVTMMVWMAQASAAADERQPGARRWGGVWPVVGWLIPLANFVLPKLAMNEIERSVTRSVAIGRVWWVCWVAAPIALAFGDPVYGVWSADDADPGQQYWAFVLLGAAMLLWAISAAAGAVNIRRIGRALSR